MIIWTVLVIAIGGVCLYKGRQSPMTKGEQFWEQVGVSRRKNSFLMDTTKHEPYNGVEN